MTEKAILPSMSSLYDPVSPTLWYIGSSGSGTATSAALWQISRLTFDGSGNITSQKWADGNSNLDNVWDDRASLTYT